MQLQINECIDNFDTKPLKSFNEKPRKESIVVEITDKIYVTYQHQRQKPKSHAELQIPDSTVIRNVKNL